MPAKRLSMRKLKDVLRLKIEHGLTDRAVARSCSVSHRTVAEYVQRFVSSGLPWPLPEHMDESALHGKLFPERGRQSGPASPRPMPDMKYLLDWIGAQTRMLEYFGAVPALVVPDNTKTGVTRACRYEPDLNPTYLDFADHYGLAILPTRVAKPRDKAKVENAVRIAERMILGGLRDQVFFSLAELNEAIRRVLADLNHRKSLLSKIV